MKKTGLLKKVKAIPIKNCERKDEEARYLFAAQVVGEILAIDLYKTPEKTRPILRAFFDRANSQWISQKEDGDWSKATLENLAPRAVRPWWRDEIVAVEGNDGDAQIIESYFGGKKGEGFEAAVEYQRKTLKKRLAKKHDLIKLRIDDAMERVGEPPEDFSEWIEEEVMRPYRYIYYTYCASKKQHGTCTYCRQDVAVEGAKHNTKGICPNCKSEVIYKAKKKAAPISEREAVSVIVDYNETGSCKKVLRVFAIERSIEKLGENIRTTIREIHRTVLDENLREIRAYSYAKFKSTSETRWCEGGNGGHVLARLYPKNLIEHTAQCKNTALVAFTQKGNTKIALTDYIEELQRYPEMEYLVRSGLCRLVSEAWMIRSGHYPDLVDRSKRKPAEYLKLDSYNLELCKKLDLGAREVTFLQQLVETKTRIREEDLIELMRRGEIRSDMATILSHASLARSDRYLEAQKNLHSRAYMINHYADYLRMCEQLGDDLKSDFIKFPRNLLTAHDTAVKRLDIEKAKQQNEAIGALYKELQDRYHMTCGGYLIKAPETAEELVKEGQELKHCVASYIDRIIQRRTTVLFIREEKETSKPFATMEIQNNKIIQVRGHANKDLRKDLKKLITKFKKEKKVS